VTKAAAGSDVICTTVKGPQITVDAPTLKRLMTSEGLYDQEFHDTDGALREVPWIWFGDSSSNNSSLASRSTT
jgi:hypothetical protein